MTEEEFDELRRSAFAIAYRMLGSVSEAEDVVEEAPATSPRSRKPRHSGAPGKESGWDSAPHGPAAMTPTGALGRPETRATGLEPATSGVTGRRSNQLSYAR